MAAQNKFSSNLLAIAGFITAIGGLVTVLHTTGVISINSSKEPVENVKKQVVQPQNLVSDDSKEVATSNGAHKSQKEMDAIKAQLDETQAQLNQIKKGSSKKSVPTTPVNTNTSSPTIVTGTWQDAISYGKYVFAQDAYGTVSFQEHSIIDDVWIITAEGTGTLKNNRLLLDYMTLYGTSGRFDGNLQNDGSIQGVASDISSGIQTQLHLKRQ
jgi:hypothetical protein